jgi:hypothetical protein
MSYTDFVPVSIPIGEIARFDSNSAEPLFTRDIGLDKYKIFPL